MRGDDTREEEDDERARGWARLACDRAVEHAGGETAVEDLVTAMVMVSRAAGQACWGTAEDLCDAAAVRSARVLREAFDGSAAPVRSAAPVGGMARHGGKGGEEERREECDGEGAACRHLS